MIHTWIAGNPEWDKIIKAILFCLLVGGGLIVSAIRRQRRVRQIQDTPRSKTASAPQGFVELEGFAWPAGDVVRSVNGNETVYYAVELQREESRGSGKSRRKVWVTVWTHKPNLPLFLVDPTGLALIDPGEATLELSHTTTRLWKALPQSEQERVRTLMGAFDVKGFPLSVGFFGNLFASKYRLVETEIDIGAPLYATGDFRAVENAPQKIKSPGLTDFNNKVFDLAARTRKDMTVALDTNRDGKVSDQELQQGYVTAAKTSRLRGRSGGEEMEFELHGTLGKSLNHALNVADLFESNLTAKLNKGFWPRLIGGSALVTVGIALALVSLAPTLFTDPPWTRAERARRLVASRPSRPPINILHHSCFAGTKTDCQYLIDHRAEYQLSSEYVAHYAAQLCQLGESSHCTPAH